MKYISFKSFHAGEHELHEAALRKAAITALALKSKKNGKMATKEFHEVLNVLSGKSASDAVDPHLERLEKGIYHLARGLLFQGNQIADGVSIDAASQLIRDRLLKDIHKQIRNGR